MRTIRILFKDGGQTELSWNQETVYQFGKPSNDSLAKFVERYEGICDRKIPGATVESNGKTVAIYFNQKLAAAPPKDVDMLDPECKMKAPQSIERACHKLLGIMFSAGCEAPEHLWLKENTGAVEVAFPCGDWPHEFKVAKFDSLEEAIAHYEKLLAKASNERLFV